MIAETIAVPVSMIIATLLVFMGFISWMAQTLYKTNVLQSEMRVQVQQLQKDVLKLQQRIENAKN